MRISQHMSGASGRRGFTLVELLVVISLMLVLAGIMVMFWPGVNESQRAAQGASDVQGFLKIAKQRALRDQAPRGVRFFVTTVDGVAKRVVEAQYIEQPADYVSGTVTILNGSTTATLEDGGTLSNGMAQALWPVQPNDYLEMVSRRLVKKILSVDPSGKKMTVSFASGFDTVKSEYRIIRGPRVAAEDKLTLPTDIVIDLNTNTANSADPVSNADGDLDIMFAPSGNVIGDQASLDYVFLWVRDVAKYPSDFFGGEPTVIGVNVRSGVVAAYPPSQTGDPYQFVKAGGTTQ